MNTLQGRPADRVPVLAVLGAYGGRLTGTDLRTLYTDPAAYVAGQRALQETFGFDLVLAPFDFSAIATAFGGETAWFDDQAPNMKRPAVRNAAEALALPLPEPERTGRLPFILESTRLLAAEYREQVPVFAAVPGPAILPGLVMGLEAWMETVLFDEPAARRVLKHTGAFWAAWANALLAAGAAGLVVTEGMAPAEVMPCELFVERLLPHLRTTFAQVRGPLVFHHNGGRLGPILDTLPGLPGVIGVAVGSKDDLVEARRRLGPGLALLGNLEDLSFSTSTADEIRQRSLACLEVAAPAGRYLLAHGGADIPMTTPPENLRAMLAASVDYAAGARSAL